VSGRITRRGCRQGAVKAQGARAPRRAHATKNVYSPREWQLSGLEDVGFNDFNKDDFVPEGDGQVASGSASLPDPWRQRSRHSKESRMNVMFLKHWVSTTAGLINNAALHILWKEA